MSLNRSVQKPLLKVATKSPTISPDYVGLIRFLIQPFLESPDSLSVDCEMYHTHKRAWIRIAFESTDKGKVFGRGGRNIQAIRTVIAAAAEAAGHSVYLDIYGSNDIGREGVSFEQEGEERLPQPRSKERRGNGTRPVVKSRSL
ncbi:KH domain-containing protein [Chlorogloeopsis sp. ULAP02]|uniref:KH domain-containing protein n=1 Tax=Chlorogloeopsis sp. ULAP02 TaxID=3107926 RepID=UPI003136FCD1